MQRKRRRLERRLVVLALLPLGGCGTVDARPDYAEARSHIAEATGQQAIYRPEDEEWSQTKVQELLADGLTVDEAVQVCLLCNPTLQASFMQIGAAKADVVQSGLFSNPSLGLALRFPSGGGLVALEAGLLQNIAELWQIPLRQRSAQGQLERTILQVARHASELALETKAAYYEAVAARQAVEVAQENQRIARELLQLVMDRQEAGAASQVDVNLASSELLENEVRVRDTELDAYETMRLLVTLLGLEEENPQELLLLDSLPQPRALPAEAEKLVALAREKRLDLQAARKTLAATEARLALEHRSVLEMPGLGAALERESDGEWSAGPAIELALPLFDQNRAKIAKARFEHRQAQKTLAALELLASQQVRGAVKRAQVASETSRFYRDKVLPQRQQGLELAREAYRLGKAPLLAFLEAQRVLIATRQQYLQRLRTSAKATADLEQATGQPISVLEQESGNGRKK